MKKIKMKNKEIEISDEEYEALEKKYLRDANDASYDCLYDDGELIYINPYNNKQAMTYNKNTMKVLYKNTSFNNMNKQKIAWKKNKSMGKLKVGDVVRVCYDDDCDKGVISEMFDGSDIMHIQKFTEDGTKIMMCNIIQYSIEKAVYEGERK